MAYADVFLLHQLTANSHKWNSKKTLVEVILLRSEGTPSGSYQLTLELCPLWSSSNFFGCYFHWRMFPLQLFLTILLPAPIRQSYIYGPTAFSLSIERWWRRVCMRLAEDGRPYMNFLFKYEIIKIFLKRFSEQDHNNYIRILNKDENCV